MQKIQAQIIADSRNIFGHRLTSVVATFPRFILAELNTHRVFTRNSASSRAVPFATMVKKVEQDPFRPIAWQKDHKGMQGTEYLDELSASEIDPVFIPQMTGRQLLNSIWATTSEDEFEAPGGSAAYHAIQSAKELSKYGVTKQLANRLLEPFMWHTAIITSSEWENFQNLRSPQYSSYKNIYKSRKDILRGADISDFEDYSKFSEVDWLKVNKGQAEIHIMALAESIWDAMNESTPKILQPEEWHIPFGDNIDENRIADTLYLLNNQQFLVHKADINQAKIEIATARCARVSYINYEGKDDYESDFRLYKQLKDSGSNSSFHASPFEHCAKAMSEKDMDNFMRMEDGIVDAGWCRNFKGFIQNRYLIEKSFVS